MRGSHVKMRLAAGLALTLRRGPTDSILWVSAGCSRALRAAYDDCSICAEAGHAGGSGRGSFVPSDLLIDARERLFVPVVTSDFA